MTIRLAVVDFLYGWSIVAMRLSGTAIEIWRFKVHVHANTERRTERPIF